MIFRETQVGKCTVKKDVECKEGCFIKSNIGTYSRNMYYVYVIFCLATQIEDMGCIEDLQDEKSIDGEPIELRTRDTTGLFQCGSDLYTTCFLCKPKKSQRNQDNGT